MRKGISRIKDVIQSHERKQEIIKKKKRVRGGDLHHERVHFIPGIQLQRIVRIIRKQKS